MNPSEPESVLPRSAPRGRARFDGEPAAPSPPASDRDSPDGIWTALARHLDVGEYRPERSPAVITVPTTTRHGEAYYVLANRDGGQ